MLELIGIGHLLLKEVLRERIDRQKHAFELNVRCVLACLEREVNRETRRD
jgi:hypothetical protein